MIGEIAEFFKFKKDRLDWNAIIESEHEFISDDERQCLEEIKINGEFIDQEELLKELEINKEEWTI